MGNRNGGFLQKEIDSGAAWVIGAPVGLQFCRPKTLEIHDATYYPYFVVITPFLSPWAVRSFRPPCHATGDQQRRG